MWVSGDDARSGHLRWCPLGGYVDTSGRAVAPREPTRRRWAVEEKRRIVEQTLATGGSVARVARAHGVNANQVFQWRRQYRRGLLGPGNTEAVSLLPVCVTDASAREAVQSSGEQRRRTALGMIQVELPKGQVRITGSIDTESLRVVLEYLLG
jgi:transposase